LTTVAQDYEGIATAGMEMLFSRIGQNNRARAGKPTARQFEAKLIMRDSA
jgi:DNA-binding LacI/PurR family transcriptional regulator